MGSPINLQALCFSVTFVTFSTVFLLFLQNLLVEILYHKQEPLSLSVFRMVFRFSEKSKLKLFLNSRRLLVPNHNREHKKAEPKLCGVDRMKFIAVTVIFRFFSEFLWLYSTIHRQLFHLLCCKRCLKAGMYLGAAIPVAILSMLKRGTLSFRFATIFYLSR